MERAAGRHRAGRRGRRHHRLRWLLVVVLVLVGLYAAGDVAAQSSSANKLAEIVKAKTSARRVSAQVSSPWLLYELAVEGRVPSAAVELEGVHAGKLDLAVVDIHASGLRIDRQAFLAHRQLRVSSISSATVEVTLTAADLSKAVGRPVELVGHDIVKVKVGPIWVPAVLGVAGHKLTVSEAGIRLLEVDLSVARVVPPCALQLTIGAGQARLSCHVSPVPSSLLSALSADS